MQIEQALLTYLKAQSTLTALVPAQRIHLGWVTNQSTESPYMCISKIDRPSFHSHDGASNMATPRFQFSIFGASYGVIKPVTPVLKTLLDGYRGTMGGSSGVEVQRSTWEDETDLDPGDSGFYGIACDYILWHGAES